MPSPSSVSRRHQQAYISLGFRLRCFKDGISSDTMSLKAGTILGGWEGQQLPIANLIKDKCASSYKILNTRVLLIAHCFLPGKRQLFVAWHRCWRTRDVSLGTRRMELPSLETETPSWNSKPKCAFQLAAPKFTFQSLIWYREKGVPLARVYLPLSGSGAFFILFCWVSKLPEYISWWGIVVGIFLV